LVLPLACDPCLIGTDIVSMSTVQSLKLQFQAVAAWNIVPIAALQKKNKWVVLLSCGLSTATVQVADTTTTRQVRHRHCRLRSLLKEISEP
jgi:hypothetical protein